MDKKRYLVETSRGRTVVEARNAREALHKGIWAINHNSSTWYKELRTDITIKVTKVA